jgi:hypothetical protein
MGEKERRVNVNNGNSDLWWSHGRARAHAPSYNFPNKQSHHYICPIKKRKKKKKRRASACHAHPTLLHSHKIKDKIIKSF